MRRIARYVDIFNTQRSTAHEHSIRQAVISFSLAEGHLRAKTQVFPPFSSFQENMFYHFTYFTRFTRNTIIRGILELSDDVAIENFYSYY